MEEKVVEGKEKKYVLYTVVGEERGRAGVGVWVLRVLMGTLLLVALAVVPYVSLRLAQVNDHTLVVYQPMPSNKHTQTSKHHPGHHDHTKGNHMETHGVLQSASLTRENYTAESNKTVKGAITASASANNSNNSSSSKSSSTSSSNTSSSSSSSSSGGSTGGIVTLHESAVTLAVMEDTNTTRNSDNDTDDDQVADHSHDDKTEKVEEDEEEKNVEETATTEVPGTSEDPASGAQVAAVTVVVSPSTPAVAVADNSTGTETTTSAPQKSANLTSVAPAAPAVSTAALLASASVTSTTHAPVHTTGKVPSTKEVKVPSVVSTVKGVTNTTSSPTTSTSTSSRPPLAHKLVYVATTASGNHVGGFCVWKTDKTITRWSYFYENIPIEYQSQQDSPDHEMRGMLAAVRTWAPLWHDHHVVLRSHHPTIKGSDHPTRRALTRELERLSEGHFTYELEWRLRKTDRVVDISYCLSRLHRDFVHWYRTFQGHVDELLGQQDWDVAKRENKVEISREAFFTDYPNDLDDITREK